MGAHLSLRVAGPDAPTCPWRGPTDRLGRAAVTRIDWQTVLVSLTLSDVERATPPSKQRDEVLRVTKPGGRIVVTSWSPKGRISQVGACLRDAMAILAPSMKRRAPPSWGEPSFLISVVR